MATLENILFPSGDVWMAAHIQDKKEHFELRTAEDGGDGFHVIWSGTAAMGSCLTDFIYQDDKLVQKALTLVTAMASSIRSQGSSNDENYQKLRLNVLTLARTLPDINALYLPAAAEMMRLIAGDDEKINTRPLKKIVEGYAVWRKMLLALADNVYGAPPNKDRAQLYMKQHYAEPQTYPALRFGEIHLEAVKPEMQFSLGHMGELIFTMEVPDFSGENDCFILDVLNTRSPEQLLHYVIDRYLQSQVTMKRCKYCRRFFVVRSSYASEYCDRPIEGSSGTCKEVGAGKVYDKRKSEDPIDRAYKRAYKTHYARIKYGLMTKADFTAWSILAREKRDECHAGKITLEELDTWLEQDRIR